MFCTTLYEFVTPLEETMLSDFRDFTKKGKIVALWGTPQILP